MTRRAAGAILAGVLIADAVIFAAILPSPVLDRAPTSRPAPAATRPASGESNATAGGLGGADLIVPPASSPRARRGTPADPTVATPAPTRTPKPTARPTRAPAPTPKPTAPRRAPTPTRTPSAAAPYAVWSGRASWYDDGPGLYAAVPHWSGVRFALEVRAGGRSVTVTVRDSCGCYLGTRDERAIDLSPAAFAQLGPLSAGILEVRISGRRVR